MGVLRARRALRVGPWITLASYPPPYLRLLVIYKMTGLLKIMCLCRQVGVNLGVLSRNRRKFRQPINVACPAPGRWGRPNSRVTSRHFDHGNASRTSRPDCSGLDEAD